MSRPPSEFRPTSLPRTVLLRMSRLRTWLLRMSLLRTVLFLISRLSIEPVASP